MIQRAPQRTRPFDPRRLDVAAFCRRAGVAEGEWSPSDFPRLAESMLRTDDGAAQGQAVAWSLRGELRPAHGGEPQPWLHLVVRARVRVECQRCLNPLDTELDVERSFRFVAGEDEAARLDEESDEDVLELTPRLDLMALAEDELILALPLVPRHEVCVAPQAEREPASTAGGVPADAPPADQPHPFGALAKLRETR